MDSEHRQAGAGSSGVVLRGAHNRKETKKPKEGGDVVEQFIGYIVTLMVTVGMGFVLPRWFEWRRSLINRWPGERGTPPSLDVRATCPTRSAQRP